MAILSLQTEYAFANGADLNFIVKPPFASPWRLESILWRRSGGGVPAIDIEIQVVYQGDIFTLDKVAGTGDLSYHFPNSRVPFPIALGDKMLIIFKTTGIVACMTSVVINWSQIGE